MKKLFLAYCGIFIATFAIGQSIDNLSKEADSLYNAKMYAKAAIVFQKMGNTVWIPAEKKSHYYNAACCFALAKEIDQSFDLLYLSIKNGYANKQHLNSDSDLEILHNNKRWNKVLSAIQQVKNTHVPDKVRLIQSDIQLFYHSFEKALKDSVHAASIFKNEYFLKGTIGLQDFYAIKIHDVNKFANYVLTHQTFYRSIKSTLLDINSLDKQIYSHLNGFKKRYPEGEFPNVYFVIGMQTSNGTVSENGLLIGAEVMSKTPTNSVDWQQEDVDWVMNFSQIPVTISHEIVHFNQNGMKNENTLLKYAIVEGSAEFLAELITTKTDGNYASFKGREKPIWNDFKNEMNQDIYNEWLHGNEPKRPRNGMYWAGYVICKSYYEAAIDKSKAIHEMLNVQSYQDFFKKSKVDVFVERHF